jgi:4-amino-4-deoxy-L-arabinose transferase-like glycosyltransferase
VLPFLNLMLDVPAAALGLLALALCLCACDRASLGWAAAAGLVGGLAMQTKYTAAAAVAGMLVWGALQARVRYALVAAFVAC